MRHNGFTAFGDHRSLPCSISATVLVAGRRNANAYDTVTGEQTNISWAVPV